LKVTLYTREDCGLCEEAEAILRRLQQSIRFEIEVVYIEDDSALFRRYHDRVPVVVMDDDEVASAPLEEARLLAVLSSSAG